MPTEGVETNAGSGEASRPPLRIAIIGTPRSGNSWIRVALRLLYELDEVTGHRPTEIDWDHLPPRCVIQIHWPPTLEFVASLERAGVRVIVPARHPLDVLISWLNLALYSHLDGKCNGSVCTECSIVGVLPTSEAFLDYARGEHGRLLLSFSPSWWIRPGVIQVRYEELAGSPEAGFAALGLALGQTPIVPIAGVVEETSIARTKPVEGVWHFHYWQGQPGLWRTFIPADTARQIANAVPNAFSTLDYPCDADPSLDAPTADRNWLQLQLDTTRDHLRVERTKHRNKLDEFDAQKELLERVHQWLVDERIRHGETLHSLNETRLRLDTSHSPFRRVARRLRSLLGRIAPFRSH